VVLPEFSVIRAGGRRRWPPGGPAAAAWPKGGPGVARRHVERTPSGRRKSAVADAPAARGGDFT